MCPLVPGDMDDTVCHKIMWLPILGVIPPRKADQGLAAVGGILSQEELYRAYGVVGEPLDFSLLQHVSHWMHLVPVKLGKLR